MAGRERDRADDVDALNELILAWADEWRASGATVATEHRAQPDEVGHVHWLVRVRGEEKDVITIWISLRQRSVFFETEVTPAPEEHHEALYRFALVKNAQLRDVRFAIGPEDGIYLVASVPFADLSATRLDELLGATVHTVEEVFVTMMTLGLASVFRPRPKR